MNTPDPDVQLVYRLECGPTRRDMPPAGGFQLFSLPWHLIAQIQPLKRAVGWGGVLKTAAKLFTSRRHFFTVFCGDVMAHHGWVTIGTCRYYQVETDAVVIGPVETAPVFRGRGLATVGLMAVVAGFLRKGYTIFYIDTADTNVPMQRVIGKCGFGKPVSTYVRPEGGL